MSKVSYKSVNHGAHAPIFEDRCLPLLTSKLLGHSRTLHRDRLIAGGDRDLGSPKAELRRGAWSEDARPSAGGRQPAALLAWPGRRVVVVYEGTSNQRLWNVVDRLDQHGRIQGQEHHSGVGCIQPPPPIAGLRERSPTRRLPVSASSTHARTHAAHHWLEHRAATGAGYLAVAVGRDDVGHDSPVLFPAAGLLLSLIGYVAGANDLYLVELYRKQLAWTAKTLLKVAKPQAVYDDWLHAGRDPTDVEDILEKLTSWRLRSVSVTRLPALLSLVFFLVWLVVLIL